MSHITVVKAPLEDSGAYGGYCRRLQEEIRRMESPMDSIEFCYEGIGWSRCKCYTSRDYNFRYEIIPEEERRSPDMACWLKDQLCEETAYGPDPSTAARILSERLRGRIEDAKARTGHRRMSLADANLIALAQQQIVRLRSMIED